MSELLNEIEHIRERMYQLESALYGDLSKDEKAQYLDLLKAYCEKKIKLQNEMGAFDGNEG